MGTDSPFDSFSVPPKKRLKTLNPNSKGEFNQYELAEKQDGEENDSRPKQSVLTDDSESLPCGICLSDNGNAIRGEIDSCDHFFCFVCIMEWAKVESRCPMCKRRFTTIRRPPKEGVFPSERLVNVLQRDQVYHFSGNTSIGTFDPYAQTQCSACHSSADESLLLLCDLCDSAAHTYCVGLGFTVPEGDWFCHDCVVSKTEHENIQKDEEDVNQDLCRMSNEVRAAESDVALRNQKISDISNVIPVDQADVSIFDIVCDSDEPVLACLRARSASFPHGRLPNLLDEMYLPVERTQTRHRRTPQSKSENITQNGARTLSRCRNVRSYVQALRENWNALQNGSLRFSSTSTASSSSNFRNCNAVAVSHVCSGRANSSSSANDRKGTKNDYLRGTFAHNRCSYDVDKAWKMMDKAKSVKQVCLQNNSVCGVLKDPPYKGTASKKAIDGSSCPDLSRRQVLANRELRNSHLTDKQNKLYSPRKETDEHLCTKWRMQKHSLNMCKAITGCNDKWPNSLPGLSASESLSASSWKVQTSRAGNACNENWETLAQKNVTDMQDGSGSSVTPVMSVPEVSESLNIIADLSASSPCRADVPEEDLKIKTGCTGSKAGKYEDAKSEIQLLVKLNLKLINGHKQLGKNGFKEVARVVTHTILAACGFGQSRHVFQSVPSSVCCHSDGIQKLHKSTLMPNSCRECFYVFVKDVVNLVLSDKLSKARTT